MARVDKTESAVGVTRGTLAADIASADWNKPLPVGLNAQGNVVKGAGNSGIVGVIIADKTRNRAGVRIDIFGNGTEVVDCAGLVAGTKYYSDAAGAVSTTNTGTYLGFTVEADRLVLTI